MIYLSPIGLFISIINAVFCGTTSGSSLFAIIPVYGVSITQWVNSVYAILFILLFSFVTRYGDLANMGTIKSKIVSENDQKIPQS